MFALLAHIDCKPTKSGISFTWQGAWEYDPVSGTGSVKLRKDGYLRGRISIKGGDKSTFIAKKAEEPDESIPEPPSYRDKGNNIINNHLLYSQITTKLNLV